MSDTTVYILGAACSVKYGYPLAADFIPAFESFSLSLGNDVEMLKRAVEETVALMREAKASTLSGDDWLSAVTQTDPGVVGAG